MVGTDGEGMEETDGEVLDLIAVRCRLIVTSPGCVVVVLCHCLVVVPSCV